MAITSKSQKIRVFEDTRRVIIDGYYTNERGEDVDLEEDFLTAATYYSHVKPTNGYLAGRFKTKTYVQLIDCVQKAIEFGDQGALLNMASRFKPGGGVINGSSAQEEEICRRTTLSYSLFCYSRSTSGLYGYPKSYPEAYPVKSDKAGLWSPGVQIFKDRDYRYLPEPVTTNVISVPGVQKPELTSDGKAFKELPERMWRNKIRTVLRIALMAGKTKLILGAWGCGAYGNPAPLVAGLFKEALEDPEFKGAFEEVCFAIIEDRNSAKGGNYAPFDAVFGHVR